MKKLFIVLFILLFRLDLGLTSAYAENRILPPSHLRIVQSTIIDSYSESYRNQNVGLFSGDYTKEAQSFTGNGLTLDRCKFYMCKFGSPTGNVVAVLYAYSGTWATQSGLPTGAPLATSDPIDVSTLVDFGSYPGTFALVEFTFSSPYTLIDGTHYFLSLEYSGGNISNYIMLGADPSGSHPGNEATYDSSVSKWEYYSGTDVCFYALSN